MNHNWVRFPSKGLVLILLLIGLFVAYLLIKPGPPQTMTLVDNLIQGLLEGVGLLLILSLWLPGSGRKWPSVRSLLPGTAGTNPAQQWVPLLLGLGILSYILGQGIWTYNENIAHLPVLFPSWADAGYLGSYPFVLLAILLLPRQPLVAQTRLRVLLDGLIIMVGVATFSWYFLLGPMILNGAATVAGRIVAAAYPLATLVLIFCLLRLMARNYDREMQPVVLLLTVALIVIVITDTAYGYLELHNLYVTGGLLDIGWPLGYMLIGLSARAMQLQLASGSLSTTHAPVAIASPEASESIRPPSSLWRAVIPSLFVFAVLLLLVWVEFGAPDTVLESGVFLGAFILLGLLLVRQTLVIQETISQNHLLHKLQRDLWARNEALQRANAQIEEQAQIEAAYEQQRRLNELKDQFVMNVSHELRTPLTQVYGYLDLLTTYQETLTSEKRTRFIQQATQGCETLLMLINTILDAVGTGSHMTPPQAQKLVVASLVHEVLEQFEPQRQEHPVHLEISEGLAVQADRQFLYQVLCNLLSNAFKYTPPQTPIRIVATRCNPASNGTDDLSEVRICVQDTGPGIPPEDIPLLFGKFVRLKRDLASSIRGTGLGLYISKQLVEAMGGKIWVESDGIAGQGSRFYFTLPAPALDRQDKLGVLGAQ